MKSYGLSEYAFLLLCFYKIPYHIKIVSYIIVKYVKVCAMTRHYIYNYLSCP